MFMLHHRHSGTFEGGLFGSKFYLPWFGLRCESTRSECNLWYGEGLRYSIEVWCPPCSTFISVRRVFYFVYLILRLGQGRHCLYAYFPTGGGCPTVQSLQRYPVRPGHYWYRNLFFHGIYSVHFLWTVSSYFMFSHAWMRPSATSLTLTGLP